MNQTQKTTKTQREKGRFSTKTKAAAVLRLLRCEGLEAVSREVGEVEPGLPLDDLPCDESEGTPIYVGMIVHTRTFDDAEVIGSGVTLELRLSNREAKTVMGRFEEPL